MKKLPEDRVKRFIQQKSGETGVCIADVAALAWQPSPMAELLQ